MPFRFINTPLDGLIIIKPEVFRDERGSFMEIYKKTEFKSHGISVEFTQDNYSISKKGVIRGLHFQRPPHEQAKLVRCVKGIIYDVAVDLRDNSTTFGKYFAVILSEYNNHMLFIPEGFAHGFQVISEEAHVHYKVSSEYAPQYEAGIRWDDPDIGIEWPLSSPLLSKRDKGWPFLKDLSSILNRG